MSDKETKLRAAEVLAAEFAEKLREGDAPSVEDYVARHRHCGSELRELLLTILGLEQLKNQNGPGAAPTNFDSVEIKRLGDLKIVREIGRGGMGIVYEAIQESLDRTVAVKVLPKGRVQNTQALARFQREAKIAASLHHTNIVPVLGVGHEESHYYYVMQRVHGVGLDEVIKHLRDEETSNSASSSPPEDVRSVALRLIQRNESPPTVGDLQPTSTTHDNVSDASRNASNAPRTVELNRRPLRFSPAYWRSIARTAQRVASALQYAHDQGTLHRDIKPSNLLLDSHGEVSIADFGLATSVDQAGISRSGNVVGTLRYVAPEQLAGAEDNRCDVYSLGVTLYELATLQPFYDEAKLAHTLTHRAAPKPPRPTAIRPDMPPDLETIIVKAMDVEPAARYQSAAELSEDLRRFCEDRPILAKRTTAFEHFWRWSRRNPAVATLSTVAASLLLAIAAVSITAYLRTNQARQIAVDQRNKADRTAESAFLALDEIFQSLAPMPMAKPEELIESPEEGNLRAASPIPTKQSAALLEKMLTFYGQIAEAGQDEPRYGRRLAEAHRRIGDIRQQLGQVALASASYRHSADLYRQLLTSDQSPTLISRLAAVHNELGTCAHHLRREQRPLPDLSEQNNRDLGLKEYQAAKMLLEPIAKQDAPPEVRYELAHTYYLLSDTPRTGQSTGLDGEQRRRQTEPANDAPGSKNPGAPQAGISQTAQPGHQKPNDNELLEKATEILQQLNEEYPGSPEYQQLLAMCHIEYSKQLWMSAPQKSQQLQQEATVILTKLVSQYPDNPDFRLALCSSHAIGRVSSPRLDREAMRAYAARLETAESMITELRADFPNVPQYLLVHLKLFRQLAALHGRLDGTAAQLPVFRRASKVCRNARPDAITNVSFKSVIEVYDRTANLLLAAAADHSHENLVDALSVLEAGVALFEQLEARSSETSGNPLKAKFLARLVEVQERLGHTAPAGSPQASGVEQRFPLRFCDGRPVFAAVSPAHAMRRSTR